MAAEAAGPKRQALIVAGGGTGGHVLAGVAVADAWKARYGDKASILFVGARGGIEEKLVPRAGYSLELLDLGSLNRVSLARKLRTFIQLPLCLLKSALILMRFRPEAVLGVGGYASGPIVLMAKIFRIERTAILEQNSVPGLTNRILGRVAQRIFSAFPGTEKFFDPKKVSITGNPVRESIERLSVEVLSSSPAGGPAARTPFTVFIFGGSQGAQGINTLVLQTLPLLKDAIAESKLKLVHQTGDRDYERVRQGYASAGVPAKVEKFIYEMPQMYAEASLVICRAGSSTLSEIAAVGRASVLIPFPQASDNHQEHNARVFSEAGSAILLIQDDAKGAELAGIIKNLMAHPEHLVEMERLVRAFHRPQAAQRIVDLLRLT